MFRQLLQALRFAIDDFFAVPWQAVTAMLATVLLLGTCAYIRTVHGSSSHNMLQMLLFTGALTEFSVAANYLKKR